MKVIFLLVALSLFGCVEDEPQLRIEPREIALGIERAEHSDEVRLRADGLTVWMRPKIETPTDFRSTWILSGRISRNISTINGTVDGDQLDIAHVSNRKFEISITTDLFEKALIHGLLVNVETSAGTHTIRLSLEGRLSRGDGSSYIYPYRQIRLIADGGKPVFRATVSTRKNFDTLNGTNDDDSEPSSLKVSDRKFYLDFQQGLLTWAATPYHDALVLVGHANGKRYHRHAFIGLALVKIGLTNSDPAEMWPTPQCDEAGDVHQQLACGPHPKEALFRTFANDFRSFIISHYRANSDDIEQAGGVHRTQALLTVDTARMYEITSSSHTDDSAHTILLAHPDILFPDSGKRWVGAYDRSSGDLLEISHQN